MSRYQLPPRVAPSPATKEPGHQNVTSRLRSSREAQARLLAERLAETSASEEDDGRREGQSAEEAAPAGPIAADLAGVEPAGGAGPKSRAVSQVQPEESRKEKLVVTFRLANTLERRIADMPGAQGVSKDYVLRALAKEGRAVLRRLKGRDELVSFIPVAKEFRKLGARDRTVGETMTVYVHLDVIAAMHEALEDPWIIEPRATVVGAFLAAIVTRLIEARRAG